MFGFTHFSRNTFQKKLITPQTFLDHKNLIWGKGSYLFLELFELSIDLGVGNVKRSNNIKSNPRCAVHLHSSAFVDIITPCVFILYKL